jgi:hypothetical protein
MIQDVNVYDLKKLRVDKKPRPIQIELLEFAKQSVLANNKYIIIDAPTGCLTKNEKINIYILKDANINFDKNNKR